MVKPYKDSPRYELINGQEHLMTQPTINHSRVLNNLSGIMRSFLRGKRCKYFTEINVFLDDNNYFAPDLVVVCDKQKIKIDGIHGAPDLVIEVLSPSTAKYDRKEKKQIYEHYGVREYWLVNPKDKSVEVWHLIDGRFDLDYIYQAFEPIEWDMLTESEQQEMRLKLKLSLYDDFFVDVQEIFEDML